MQNYSRKFGNVICIRVQLHVTAIIPNGTQIIQAPVSHLGYGVATIGDTNTGNEYECMVSQISVSNPNIIFTTRTNLPVGYYALTYTYVLSVPE